ncbi:MAG: hypothetical protein AMJ92_00340 [candidate division Zixibacteria bacterium SM23_81]|nr:MAG: hypothetical protein AMJ92_00340 [candidate division Zixibacteria bacterium SM23_81]
MGGSFANDLIIATESGKSREYVYTNKVAAHFSGETRSGPTRSYHGLCVRMQKLLEDWRFQLGGVECKPEETTQVLAYPHRLVRIFEHPPAREHICLLDRWNVLVVDLMAKDMDIGALWPLVDIRPVRLAVKPVYQVAWQPHNNLLLIRGTCGSKTSSGNFVWLGVTCSAPMDFSPQQRYLPTVYVRGQQREVMGRGTPFVPGLLRFRPERGRARFLFIAGRSQREVATTARVVLDSATIQVHRKKERLERLISKASVKSQDLRLNAALAWAQISLDALLMCQEEPGIYAGLPWFANYWGRDTAISLPGATWVTGQFSWAKKILATLARHQDRRVTSRTYGRIPNILEPDIKLYNTADGTLWFIRQAEEYVRYSGDVRTIRNFFPAVKRAIRGELSLRTDQNGLVVHGPAETWMDAGGEDHPVTPRDNRAIEIQALWYAALLSGAQLALLVNQPSLSAEWTRLSKGVHKAIIERFWNPKGQYLYDHINLDGSPDEQIRPNQLLALTAPLYPLLSWDQEKSILDFMLSHLVYSHGVASLAPGDPQFRPRHLGYGRYHFDQAYHNGDVWLWLTGPMVTALVRHGRREMAHILTETLTNHILDRGAVGTLGELFNASPTRENDNEAGTFTQAWSLAEYIRVVYQDYLGVKPNVPKKEVVIEPSVPAQWGDVDFQFVVSRGRVEAQYRFSAGSQTYIFQPKDLIQPLRIRLRIHLPGGVLLTLIHPLRSDRKIEIQVVSHGQGWLVRADGRRVNGHFQKTDFDVGREQKITFKKPPVSRSRI